MLVAGDEIAHAAQGVYHDWPGWQALLSAAGFVPLTHYHRPTDAPPEQQLWLASVWRKPHQQGR